MVHTLFCGKYSICATGALFMILTMFFKGLKPFYNELSLFNIRFMSINKNEKVTKTTVQTIHLPWKIV